MSLEPVNDKLKKYRNYLFNYYSNQRLKIFQLRNGKKETTSNLSDADAAKNPLNNDLILYLILEYFAQDVGALKKLRTLNSRWNNIATTLIRKKYEKDLKEYNFESNYELLRFLSVFKDRKLIHCSFIFDIPIFNLTSQNLLFMQLRDAAHTTARSINLKKYNVMSKAMWKAKFPIANSSTGTIDVISFLNNQIYHKPSNTHRIGFKNFRRLLVDHFPNLSQLIVKDMNFPEESFKEIFQNGDFLPHLTKLTYYVNNANDYSKTEKRLATEILKISKNLKELRVFFPPFNYTQVEPVHDFFFNTFYSIATYNPQVTVLGISCTKTFFERLSSGSNKELFANVKIKKLSLYSLTLENLPVIMNFIKVSTNLSYSLRNLHIAFKCNFDAEINPDTFTPYDFPNLETLTISFVNSFEGRPIKMNNNFLIKLSNNFPLLQRLTLFFVKLTGEIRFPLGWTSLKNLHLKSTILDFNVNNFFIFFDSINNQNLTNFTIETTRDNKPFSNIISTLFSSWNSNSKSCVFKYESTDLQFIQRLSISRMEAHNAHLRVEDQELISSSHLSSFPSFDRNSFANVKILNLLSFPISVEDVTTLKSIHEVFPQLETLSVSIRIFNHQHIASIASNHVPDVSIRSLLFQLNKFKALLGLTLEFDGPIENFDKCICGIADSEFEIVKAKHSNPQQLSNFSIRNFQNLATLNIKWKFSWTNMLKIPNVFSSSEATSVFFITDEGVARTFKKMSKFQSLTLSINFAGPMYGQFETQFVGIKDVFSKITTDVVKEVIYKEKKGKENVFTKTHIFL